MVLEVAIVVGILLKANKEMMKKTRGCIAIIDEEANCLNKNQWCISCEFQRFFFGNVGEGLYIVKERERHDMLS